MERLREYTRKRDFEKTLEPKGVNDSSDEALRFCVQHHIATRDHYDFRLEWKGALLSWAVPKGPTYDTKEKRLAVHVEDHPLDYRNFEGTIPKGQYGGGTVMLWDEGYWEPEENTDKSLDNGTLKFTLYGKRLKGKWALIRLKGKESDKQENWILLKEHDEYSKTSDNISDFTTSIRTGRTMYEIEEGKEEAVIKNPFKSTNVQLAKLANTIPKGDDWYYELKYDGYRILAYIENNSVQLVSRKGKDYTKHFEEIVFSLTKMADGRIMVLDGEMTVTDEEGKTNFQALQSYMRSPKGKSLTYFVFDLLALDGKDLRDKPLVKRKELLEQILKDAPPNLHYSRHVIGQGKESFEVACERGMEGIIGKKANSIYSCTRDNDWIKIKCDNRQEFVIGAYTLSDKRAHGVSSVVLGVYEGDKLIYVGRAGTGFTEAEMKRLEEKFKPIIIDNCPFSNTPDTKKGEKIIWLEPKFVAEVKFSEWTDENLLRQASYKGLRLDKDPKEVRRESPDEEIINDQAEDKEIPMEVDLESILNKIKITSPDRVIFAEPKTTKLDMIKYYAQVSHRMLPYISNRILSIVRCPKGVSSECFFKKHPGPGNNAIVTIQVENSDKEKKKYFYVKDVIGLVTEAQMGTVEFHTWGSRVEELDKPDVMVFDLDPDEGMTIDKVRRGVKDLKKILSDLNLKSYLKTSGGKGYHVVVPFVPSVSWDAFNDFAKRIAQVMEQKWPDRYTSNMRKDRRVGKIYIDWVRNGRGATSITPYSLRAREASGVSMPLAWDELDTVAPDSIDMAKALVRVTGTDPWKDFFDIEQKLK